VLNRKNSAVGAYGGPVICSVLTSLMRDLYKSTRFPLKKITTRIPLIIHSTLYPSGLIQEIVFAAIARHRSLPARKAETFVSTFVRGIDKRNVARDKLTERATFSTEAGSSPGNPKL
jgi:hypothetical protein